MKLPDEVREYFRQQGASGGKKRARNLTSEQRREGARKAAQARWAKSQNKTAQPKKSTRKGESK